MVEKIPENIIPFPEKIPDAKEQKHPEIDPNRIKPVNISEVMENAFGKTGDTEDQTRP